MAAVSVFRERKEEVITGKKVLTGGVGLSA
jgi:hypothetical protein